LKNKIRWGIMGCAKIARGQFLPALADSSNGVLQAVSSRDLAKAEECARMWGAKKAYGGYEEMLLDPLIDAVYIPLPNDLHAEWAMKALEAKKHVLCEKPLAVSLEKVTAMLETAKREERFLMEAFMYRFHPQIGQMLSWIKEGRIGEVRQVSGSFSFRLEDPANIRLRAEHGGGSLWDVGCYPIHLANLVFGSAPRKVMAQSHFEAVDLSTTGLLWYGENKQMLFDCSFVQENRQLAEVVGTEGRIIIPSPWRPDSQEVTISLIQGRERYEKGFLASNPYRLEIEHFGECIQGKAEPILPSALSLQTVATIEACYKSARTGRETEVQLD